jgi:hypothetical protein
VKGRKLPEQRSEGKEGARKGRKEIEDTPDAGKQTERKKKKENGLSNKREHREPYRGASQNASR